MRYASGVFSMEVGDFQKAGRRLEKYLELDPDHDQSRVYLSQVASGESNTTTHWPGWKRLLTVNSTLMHNCGSPPFWPVPVGSMRRLNI
ncbi:MAG: hypothetical protein Ct9H300mP16_06270 [Pseudomonadota bacterium]|nr:MAG: hypothetical protein Ct9H300mP16_06270 [Pseudomonadota bacterium]